MLRFFQELGLGLKSYWKAFIFIKEYKLYWYFFIPASLMLLIYFIGDRVLKSQITADLSNMNGIVWYFIHVALNISIALLLMKFAKYIVVIILSPLLSHISQKCEKIITGKTYEFDFKQIYSDVKRGVRLAIRNLMWEYFFFLIIFFIAWLGWDSPTQSPLFYLTFLIGFYYYGFSFIDYDNERRKLNEIQSIEFVRKHRGLAIGIGMIYSLLILVPVNLTILFSFSDMSEFSWSKIAAWLLHLLLWVCASIAPILAIVSASIAIEKTKQDGLEEKLPESL